MNVIERYKFIPSSFMRVHTPEIEIAEFSFGKIKDWGSAGKSVLSKDNVIYFIVSGHGWVEHKGITYNLHPGDVLLTSGGARRSFCCDGFIEKYWCCFSCKTASGFDILENDDLVFYSGSVREDTFPLFRSMISDRKELNTNDMLYLKTFVYCTLHQSGYFSRPSFAFPQEEEVKFQKVLSEIDKVCNNSLTVEYFGTKHGIEPNTLSKSFRRHYGVSLKKYIMNRIEKRATVLLLSGNRKVREIATELKFSSEYHFSKFFSKQTGLSPSGYRRNVRER